MYRNAFTFSTFQVNKVFLLFRVQALKIVKKDSDKMFEGCKGISMPLDQARRFIPTTTKFNFFKITLNQKRLEEIKNVTLLLTYIRLNYTNK